MTQLQSQLLGLLLGFATAVGCIFYEKLVHNFSYISMWTIIAAEMLILLCCGHFLFKNDFSNDYNKFISDAKYPIWTIIYILTGITSLLWYKITNEMNFYERLAFNCRIASPLIDVSEYCKGADHVSVFGDKDQVKIIKTIFNKKNPANNDVKAIAYDFVYTKIKHPSKVVPKGFFWFQGFDIKEGREEIIPDYEATGEKIKLAFEKLGIKVVEKDFNF